MNNELISNGSAASNTGRRALSFSQDLKLMPVVYAVHSGYQTSRATFQVKGPVVVEVSWNRSDLDLTINGEPVYKNGNVELWGNIKRLHPWADSFLDRAPRGASYIPADVVPESEYLAVKAKRSRLEKFNRRFGVGLKVDNFMTDRKGDLRLEPRALDFDPEAYVGKYLSATGSLVSINQRERWWGVKGGQATELTEGMKPAGSWVNHGDRDRSGRGSEQGTPGIPEWRSFEYLVRVVYDAHVSTHDGHYGHGHTVDVWEVPKQ